MWLVGLRTITAMSAVPAGTTSWALAATRLVVYTQRERPRVSMLQMATPSTACLVNLGHQATAHLLACRLGC